MLHLNRQALLFIEREEVAQPSRLQLVGTVVDDHLRPPRFTASIPWRLCDVTERRSQPLWTQRRESAHKCGIATLAEEHPSEVFGTSRAERDTGQRLPVSFLVIIVKGLRNAGTQSSSKRAPDSARSFLQPRALNES